MRVLLADRDPRFCTIVDGVLRAEGYALVAAHSPRDAREHLARGRFDAVVCGLDFVGEGGDVRNGQTPPPPLFLTSTRDPKDPVVAAARERLAAAGYFKKPFPVFDLVDELRAVAPAVPPTRSAEDADPKGSPSASSGAASVPKLLLPWEESPQEGRGGQEPSIAKPPALVEPPATDPAAGLARAPSGRNRQPGQDGVLVLTRVWGDRLSGRVELLDSMGHPGESITFRDGGPVNLGNWDLLRRALRGGRVRWTETEIDGFGDWTGMGALLAEGLRDPKRTDFVTRFGSRGVVSTPRASSLASLPISLAVRDLLEHAVSGMSLADLVSRSGVPEEVVGIELHLLYRLGIMRFIRLSGDAPVPDLPVKAASPRPGSQRRPGWRDQVRTRSPRGQSKVPGPSMEPDTDTDTDFGQVSSHTDSITGEDWDKPSRSARRRTARRGASSYRPMRERLDLSVGSSGPASANQRLNRLQRELQSLRVSRPHVVLAIPADSDVDTVEQGRLRMAPRYASMIEDDDAGTALRMAAKEILGIVERAYEEMLVRARAHELDLTDPSLQDDVTEIGGGRSDLSDEQKLLAMGRQSIERKAWVQADRALSAAKELVFHDPDILANLAWARLHNERFERAERVTEAQDLLLLVETLESRHPEGQRYLAHLLYQEGRFEAARVRAKRAVRLNPEDDSLRQLLRQIGRQLDG